MAVAKKNFPTVEEIKTAALNAGDKWFKPENMRFHRGRLLSGVIGGHYFIVSSKASWEDYSRVFQVCQINEDRSIQYSSNKQHGYKYQAEKEAHELFAAEVNATLVARS